MCLRMHAQMEDGPRVRRTGITMGRQASLGHAT